MVAGELTPVAGDQGPLRLVADKRTPNPPLDQVKTKFDGVELCQLIAGGGGPAKTVMLPEPVETEDPLCSGQLDGKYPG